MAPDTTQAQVEAVVDVLGDALAQTLVAAYLYGSAVSGGLRPNSDLDVLAVISQPTTRDQRADLARRLRPLSRRGERPAQWRPVELTVVAQADVKPLRFSPRTDFQYGEWLRDRFDAGEVDPEDPGNPDLVLLLAQAGSTSVPLLGPNAAQLIDDVQADLLRAAMRQSVEGLVQDVDSDTTNVLLTLARMLFTLETGRFANKDAAATWAALRCDTPARATLTRAAAIHRGEADDDWGGLDYRASAAQLAEAVRRG